MTQAHLQTADTQLAAYMSGFANEFATEALPGALPVGRNSPQRAPYGLYAEQISGTAFTAPRAHNRRAWLYRIRPAAMHKPFARMDSPRWLSHFDEVPPSPNQMRWSPPPMPSVPTDFIDGIVTMAGNGGPEAQTGCGIHLYLANQSMQDRFFYNADGEMLIVPQEGRLLIATEMGRLTVEPQEIVVIPRGVRFRVNLPDGQARGYICENFGALFKLPDLGVIGSNGLANPRDFLTPVASYEDREGKFELVARFRAPCGAPRSITRRSMSWRGMATMHRTSTICATSTRLGRSATTIRTRRFSWCCNRRRTRPESTPSIS